VGLFNDIDHVKTKVIPPQANGVDESFYKIILNEFI